MASLIQRRLSQAGLAKQTAKGTEAAAATYGYGSDGGTLFKLELDENEVPLTWSNRDILAYDRQGVKPSQSGGTLFTPSLAGLLLLGVLGADAVTGSGPYVHTMTPAATLPYLTSFGTFGTADFFSIVDSKVSSLELSWEAAGKVMAKYEIPGCTPAFLATAPTITNLEVPSNVGYFTAGGGAFTVEGTSAVVTGGSIKFDTHIVQPIASATVLPPDVVEGKTEVTWSLKILPTDTGLFREVYYGANTAGALSGVTTTPRLGAVSCTFDGPGADTLVISSTKVRFMVEFPESSPDGGPAELTLAGTSTLPSSGSSVSAVLTNTVPTY